MGFLHLQVKARSAYTVVISRHKIEIFTARLRTPIDRTRRSSTRSGDQHAAGWELMGIECYCFCLRYLQDRWADLHQIFHGNDKRAAIEQLNFWFLNSFTGGSQVKKVHFRFGPSLTKCNIATKWIYLSKKKAVRFGRIISIPNAGNVRKSVKRRLRSFGAFGEFFEHGDARLRTLPWNTVNRCWCCVLSYWRISRRFCQCWCSVFHHHHHHRPTHGGVFRAGGTIVRPSSFGLAVNFWLIFALFLYALFRDWTVKSVSQGFQWLSMFSVS